MAADAGTQAPAVGKIRVEFEFDNRDRARARAADCPNHPIENN
jgi:hypothetical protein